MKVIKKIRALDKPLPRVPQEGNGPYLSIIQNLEEELTLSFAGLSFLRHR